MAPVRIDRGIEEVVVANMIVSARSPRRFLSLDSRVKSLRGFFEGFWYSL